MKLRSLALCGSLTALACAIARADTPPYLFTAGTPISASQVNTNFATAFSAISALSASGGSGGAVKKFLVITPGPYPVDTWIPIPIPAGVNSVLVEGVGGGGGGGGATCNNMGTPGNGSSSVLQKGLFTVNPGSDSILVKIGSGGNGGSKNCSAGGSSAIGINGHDTMMQVSGASVFLVPGGQGGNGIQDTSSCSSMNGTVSAAPVTSISTGSFLTLAVGSPSSGAGGKGGLNSTNCAASGDGTSGTAGYISLTLYTQ